MLDMESPLPHAYNLTSIKESVQANKFWTPMFSHCLPNTLKKTVTAQPEVVVHPKLNGSVRLDEDGRCFDLACRGCELI